MLMRLLMLIRLRLLCAGVHAASCARFKIRATWASPSGGSISVSRLAISSKCAAMLSGVRALSGKYIPSLSTMANRA
ncbi:hypothetical protein D3C71_1923190 [compost metagenome]